MPFVLQGDRVASALRAAALPAWVERTEASLIDDWSGATALVVSVVVREGQEPIFDDGQQLVDVREKVRAALEAEGIDLWPYVRFVSAAEAA